MKLPLLVLVGLLSALPASAGPKKHAQMKFNDLTVCHYPEVACYSIYIPGPPCTRAYGYAGTPDIPWKIVKGSTWLECLDMLKKWDFGGDSYAKESTIIDFIQSGVQEPK